MEAFSCHSPQNRQQMTACLQTFNKIITKSCSVANGLIDMYRQSSGWFIDVERRKRHACLAVLEESAVASIYSSSGFVNHTTKEASLTTSSDSSRSGNQKSVVIESGCTVRRVVS